ncbi:MAG: hypothetical protein KatS3mg021_0237 [Fimbriimonadales bacterium]|nr:MAG: hypothetical protein KatS3mg021_0237 [Fimbriimonadales bacterium]
MLKNLLHHHRLQIVQHLRRLRLIQLHERERLLGRVFQQAQRLGEVLRRNFLCQPCQTAIWSLQGFSNLFGEGNGSLLHRQRLRDWVG